MACKSLKDIGDFACGQGQSVSKQLKEDEEIIKRLDAASRIKELKTESALIFTCYYNRFLIN